MGERSSAPDGFGRGRLRHNRLDGRATSCPDPYELLGASREAGQPLYELLGASREAGPEELKSVDHARRRPPR